MEVVQLDDRDNNKKRWGEQFDEQLSRFVFFQS